MGKYSEQEVRNKLKKYNFVLLNKYMNTHSNLKMKCNICGYIKSTKFSHILSGHTGCKKCMNILRLSEKEINGVLKEHNSILLGLYKNNTSPIKVNCTVCKYIWKPTFSNIRSGASECPNCSGKRQYNIKEIRKIISNKNGRLLSKEYQNVFKKLEILCLRCNNIWFPTFKNINAGHWCPICANTKSGKEQNALVEILTNLFPNYQILVNYKGFGWLKAPDTKRQLEIDIWMPKLGLAIEYDGEQHFNPIKKWGGIRRLNRQKQLDRYKNKIITKHKIIKTFIRFSYKEKINKQNVIIKLQTNIPDCAELKGLKTGEKI